MRRFFAVITSILFILMSSGVFSSASAVPTSIKYQGVLKNRGNFVSGGKVMVFRIFDAATGGNEVWTSGRANVEVIQGVFSYAMIPSGIDWGAGSYYLEVTIVDSVESAVGSRYIMTEVTLKPREEITSTVYSLRAGDIDDGIVVNSKLADGAVNTVKVSSISWVKLYDVPVNIGAAAADGMGNHVATTTLNMNNFDVTNITTVTALSVVSDNVDGYDISGQFSSIATSIGSMDSRISQLSASTAAFVNRTGDSMSGALNISTINAITRLNFADGTAITTAVGIGGAGDNMGNHIATTTLNMSGRDIVNIGAANYNAAQQFAAITASTASLKTSVTQLGLSTATLDNTKYNRTGGAVAGNIANGGYRIFTSSIQFDDGTILASTVALSGIADNMGNHQARIDVNMAGHSIVNISSINGVNITQKFGEIAASTVALSSGLDIEVSSRAAADLAIGVDTGTLRTDLTSETSDRVTSDMLIGVDTGTIRSDIDALAVSTGTIYGDSLGTHIATKTLDMAGFEIINVSTLTASIIRSATGYFDNIDFSMAALADIFAASTASLKTDILNEITARAAADLAIGVDTGTLRTDLTVLESSASLITGDISQIKLDTGTLRTDLTTETGDRVTSDKVIGVDTGTLRTDLIDETTGRIAAGLAIGVDTGTLRTDLSILESSASLITGDISQVKLDTGTLRTDLDAVTISTGGLVKKFGDTMTGVLNVSTVSAVAQINFTDGSIITSSRTLGDNLGNHIATTTLDMASFNIKNVNTIYVATSLFVNNNFDIFASTLDHLTVEAQNAGTRFLWYATKSAFRAGRVADTEWNDDNIGDGSVAMGVNTKANAAGSVAMGSGATASSMNSVSLGNNTTASGTNALASGYYTTASGDAATSMGYQSIASGNDSFAAGYQPASTGTASIALGYLTSAGGYSSFAAGYNTDANGYVATALGYRTKSSGDYALTSGYESSASGDASFTAGQWVTASAPNSFVFGKGVSNPLRVVNNIPDSMMVGFDRQSPTLFVSSASVSVDNTSMTAGLNVSSINYVSRISFADGTVLTSTSELSAIADNLGDHKARQDVNMSGYGIINAADIAANSVTSGLGYFSNIAASTNALAAADLALGVSTGALDTAKLDKSSATVTYVFRTGDTMTGNLNLGGNRLLFGSKYIYNNSGVLNVEGAVSLSSASYLSFNAEGQPTPTIGAIRMPNDAKIVSINAAGDDEVTMLHLNTFDKMVFGSGAANYDAIFMGDLTANGITNNGNLANSGFKIFTSSIQFDDGTMLASTASLASIADNLGNHTATQDLNMSGKGIINASSITVSNGSFLATGTYGSGSIPVEGAGARMMWYPGKAAFRAGLLDLPPDDSGGTFESDYQDITGTSREHYWDDAFIGDYSVALGRDTFASGYSSISLGFYSVSSGMGSTAIGMGAVALGLRSVSIGTESHAEGSGSVSIGPGIASGSNSIAIGGRSFGIKSTSIGSETLSSGTASVAIGSMSAALGDKSTAIGGAKVSENGLWSIGAGQNVRSDAANNLVLGKGIVGSNPLLNNVADSLMVGFDRTIPTLFVSSSSVSVDNTSMTAGLNVSTINYVSRINFADGTSITSTATLSSIADNLGNHTATQDLNMSGNGIVNVSSITVSSGSFLAMGTYGSGSIPVEGAGARMMWYPGKAALRAGLLDLSPDDSGAMFEFDYQEIAGTSREHYWDDAFIGKYSVALGRNTFASGDASISMGYYTVALGYASISMGWGAVALGQQSVSLGAEAHAEGNYSVSIGRGKASGSRSIAIGSSSGSWSLGTGSISIGDVAFSSGSSSVAIGHNTTAFGDYSTAIGGARVRENGLWSIGAGRNVLSDAANNLVLGKGIDGSNPLLNNVADTLMVGFDRTTPTLFVSSSSVSVDNTSMTAGLNVSTINYVSRINFADGTSITSTATLSSIADNLGNHTATQDLNMSNKNITNVNLVDGYDIPAQFGDVAASTNSLSSSVSALGASTGTLRADLTAETSDRETSDRVIGVTTGTLNADLLIEISSRVASDMAIGVDTGTLRADMNAMVVSTGDFIKKSGDTMSGALNVSTISAVSQINFADGTVIQSSSTLGDNLGNHNAVKILNMGGNSIINVSSIAATGGIVFAGSYGSGGIPVEWAGDRLMWYPGKVAFRAGGIDGTQWNDANIGAYSVAMGTNTTASGDFSTALGGGSTASGTASAALGGNSLASGYASTAIGLENIASNDASVAMGYSSTASGRFSAAFGSYATASGDWSLAAGSNSNASGPISVALGADTVASNDASVAMGYFTTAAGFGSVAMGFGSTAAGDYSTAIGSAVVNGQWSIGFGQNVRSDAANNIVFGKGASSSSPLLNNIADSFMVGFNRATPALFVSPTSVSIDNTSMTAGLNVSTINYVSRIGFADGTVLTSTAVFGSLSDNMGNHTATQDLNMSNKNITNVNLVDGYDIPAQFSDVAASTNSLSGSVAVLGDDITAETSDRATGDRVIGVTTGTLRADLTTEASDRATGDLAIGVTTGTLDAAKLDKSSATVAYLFKNEKAADSDKLDGLDSSVFAQIADLTQLKTDTGTLRTDLTAETSDRVTSDRVIGVTTGTLRADLTTETSDRMAGDTAIGITTGTLDTAKLDKSSATVAYLFKNEKAADSDKLDGLDSTAFAQLGDLTQLKIDTGTLRTDLTTETSDRVTSDKGIGVATGTLRTDLTAEISNRAASDLAIGVETGTLSSNLNDLAVSTGSLVKKSGDTMSGVLNVSTISAVAQINFTDGTIITSSSTLGDNLGTHIATQNLNMSGNGIVNVSSITVSSGSFLAMGTFGSGSIPVEGPGARMMWYPKKAAFRAVGVDGTQWNDGNIGDYSTAMGWNTTASGNYSTAMGEGTTASAPYSIATGYNSSAINDGATAMGVATTASGTASTAMGVQTFAAGQFSTAMGYGTQANGQYSTAMGYYSFANANYSTALGVTSYALGDNSISIGTRVKADAINSLILGKGTDSGQISNNIADSLMVGFDRTVPTLFVSSVSVSVDNTSMTAGLNVSTINAVSQLTFADGTVLTSTAVFGSLSDSLGNHTATQDLNMSNKNIINVDLVDGYDVSQQFADLAASSNSLSGTVSALSVSTETLRTDIITETSDRVTGDIAIGVTTGTLRADLTTETSDRATSDMAIGVDTGTLSSTLNDIVISTGNLVKKSGDTMSGELKVSTISTVAKLSFEDGTSITSTTSLVGIVDNLGNHMATQDLNLNSHNIIGAIDLTATGILNLGANSTASGSNSAVLGQYLTANRPNSIVIGKGVSDGNRLTSSNDNSIVLGVGPGPAMTIMGSSVIINATSIPNNNSPSNAVSMYGVGTMMFAGSLGTGNTLSGNYTGARMLWYGKKAAFRAGGTNSTQWSDTDLTMGDYSFAANYNTIAKGSYSSAFGVDTTAGNTADTAFGNGTTARGGSSLAVGVYSLASNYATFAAGESATASGDTAMAFGAYVTASAKNSIAFGKGSFAESMTNNTADSLMVGFNRASPSFSVFESSVNVDGSAGFSGDVLTISTGTKIVARINSNGSAYADGAWNGGGADYAEWFKKEGTINTGDIVGLNAITRRARKYAAGDILLGICSANPGFVGNRDPEKTDAEMRKDFVLVGLVGQLYCDLAQVQFAGTRVETLDGKQIGYLLEDGKVFIRIKD